MWKKTQTDCTFYSLLTPRFL